MKRLQNIGKSLGIIIDKAILDLMKVDRDTPIEFEVVDGDRLMVKFIRQPRQQRVDGSIDRVVTKHASTFRKLAK